MARFPWLIPAAAALVVTGVAVSALVVNNANTTAAVRVGSPAPNFTAQASNGQTIRLSDYRGKVVVLEWTNHECPFVIQHYSTGNMQRLQQEARAKGVVWLSVVSSAPGQQGFVTAAQANAVVRENRAMPTAVLLDPDGRLGRMYGARTTPHMFVIDRAGKLQYMGAVDDGPNLGNRNPAQANNFVRTAIQQVITGQNVTTSTTRPYGCAVKYGN